MKTFIQKISSRKFLLALGGVITGIVLFIYDNKTEGAATIISSILGYLVMEGYIDAKAVQAIKEVVDKIDIENDGDAE
jgi:hypothetical protein